MEKISTFLTANPFGIIITIGIPCLIFYLTLILKFFNPMIQFLINNPIFTGIIIIMIVCSLFIFLANYFRRLNNEIKSLKKSLNQHGGYISYFLSEYEKKKDSKYKYPRDYDPQLFGIIGWMSQSHRDEIEKSEQNKK